jgi:hypothetical protein
MRHYQTNDEDDQNQLPPEGPVKPPKGTNWWPAGYDEHALTARFGNVPRIKITGTSAESDGPWPFNPKGVVSNSWVKRGADAKLTVDQLPRPVRWLAMTHGDPDITAYDRLEWENGWVLERRAARADWFWEA